MGELGGYGKATELKPLREAAIQEPSNPYHCNTP